MLNRSTRGNNLAKSAIETALLDLQGKRLNRPVSDLLGGAIHQHLPVLWTLASGDTDKDIEEALGLIETRRHCDFKLKIGSRPVMDDVRHVAAIKAAVGDSASVRVDVNQAWDESTAARGMAELQAAGIDLVEQPTPMKDHAALVRLSDKFHLPILADEAVADAKDMYNLAAAGFAGAVAMKIAKPVVRSAPWSRPRWLRPQVLGCTAVPCSKAPSAQPLHYMPGPLLRP